MEDHDLTEVKAGSLREFAARARETARLQLIDRAALEAIEALVTEGISVVILKGPVLARLLYRPDETRTYFDADLLVSPSAREAAGAILTRLGYRNTIAMRGIDDVAGILHAEQWSRLEPGFGNVSIDLHWRLAGCAAPAVPAFERLWETRQMVEIGGHTVSALGRAALALHLALHVAQHGPEDWKAMADLQRGLERWPEACWQEAAALAAELEAVPELAVGLSLTPLGRPLLKALDLPSSDQLLREMESRSERPRGTFHIQALAEARGATERIRIVRKALFPSRAWIAWNSGLPSPGATELARAYVHHLARTPVWAVRAWRYRRRLRRVTG